MPSCVRQEIKMIFKGRGHTIIFMKRLDKLEWCTCTDAEGGESIKLMKIR